MTEHEAVVLKITRAIPTGKVMSYNQIAIYSGDPKLSREVGWAMRSLGKLDNFPWWRVLSNTGHITIGENMDATAEMQQALLEKEGVVVGDGRKLDIDTYRFRPDEAMLRSFGLDEVAAQAAIIKFQEPQQISLF